MRHLKRFIPFIPALGTALWCSPEAHATAQTYYEETVQKSPNTAALITAFLIVVLMFAAMAAAVRLGRSGMLRVSWAVLAIIFSGTAMLFAIIGSSVGTLYSKVEGDPADTVKRFYDAIIAGDYPTAYSCLSDYTGLGLETAPSSENAALVYDALKASYDYTLVGEAERDRLSATQTVRVKYLDLASLEASVEDGVQRNLEKIVESRPRSEVYDENDKYLPSVTEEAYSTSLNSVLSHADSYCTAAAIDIELTYSGGQWLIVTNQTMLNALMGGVAY